VTERLAPAPLDGPEATNVPAVGSLDTAGRTGPTMMEGYPTETTAIEALKRRGFSTAFQLAGDRLTAAGSSRQYRSDELVIRTWYRFEGVSDPDDLSIVYALESRDGTRGILVDAFGPYADPALGAFLNGVGIRADP
jgi:hypothetical protein